MLFAFTLASGSYLFSTRIYAGKPARSVDLSKEELETVKAMMLLTMKPVPLLSYKWQLNVDGYVCSGHLCGECVRRCTVERWQ